MADIRISLFILCFGLCAESMSQDTTRRDSSFLMRYLYKVKPEIQVIENYPPEVSKLDTSLFRFQWYEATQAEEWKYRNLGNTGTPVHPYVYETSSQHGFNLGYNAYRLYRFSKENIPHYLVNRPFTEIGMVVGLKKEQLFSVRHAQSIGRTFRFAFHFDRINSKGHYFNQLATHNNVAIEASFSTRNQRYNIDLLTFLNTANVRQNGGVIYQDLFNDTTFSRKELVNTELNNAFDKSFDRSVWLKQQINFGSTYSDTIRDSVPVRVVIPIFTLFHEVGISREKIEYFDESPMEDFYGVFYPEIALDSTPNMYHGSNLRSISNEVGIIFSPVKQASRDTSVLRNFQFSTSVGYRYYYLEQDSAPYQIHDSWWKASIRTPITLDSRFRYAADAFIHLSDYNAGDIFLNGAIEYHLNKYAESGAFFRLRYAEADWIQQQFSVSTFSWRNEFAKQSQWSAGLIHKIPALRLAIEATYSQLSNYIYYSSGLPIQSEKLLHLFSLKLSHRFEWKSLGISHLAYLQSPHTTKELPLPLWFSIHSFYYDTKLFKGNLAVRFGLDVSLHTPFALPDYTPVTLQFDVGNREVLGDAYPVFDFYLGLKIKTVRILLKFDHLNEGIYKDNGYFRFNKYPAPDRSFKMVLSWRLYD